ncbi:hypothetical protein BDB01DRAFT_798634 [Pilobolus umbonatus]|nr:hypothetical protein BDB01DRAFT_798634 [Pilobolus umbonatus]
MGKKRSASAASASNKKPKHVNKELLEAYQEQSEGLFDNLDEAMDSSVLEKMIHDIETLEPQDESSEEAGEEMEEEESAIESEEGKSVSESEEEAEAEAEMSASESEEEEAVEAEMSASESEEEGVEDETMESAHESTSPSKKFRDLYMTQVTQAFGTDLDLIRQVMKQWVL